MVDLTYAAFGGIEVVNNSRCYALASQAGIGWLVPGFDPGLAPALGLQASGLSKTYAWTGTFEASTSIEYDSDSTTKTNLVTNPSGEVSAAGWTGIPGTTGVMAALTNPAVATAFGAKVIHGQWTTASTALGGGLSTDVAITAGQLLSVKIGHVLASITNRLQLQVEWRTNVATISTDTSAPQTVVTGGVAQESTGFQVQGLVAPATTTVARIKLISVAGTSSSQWSIGSYLEVDGVQAHIGATLPGYYFDGDTAAVYSLTDKTLAPWYDPDMAEVSSRFYGVYGLKLTGVYDSTRTTPVTQNAGDGLVLGASRKDGRAITATVSIMAKGKDAMEYARNWVMRTLELNDCQQVGDCDKSDVVFFASVPTDVNDAQTKSRYLKFAEVTSGPFETSEDMSRGIYATTLEWTWTSEKPFIYEAPRGIDLTLAPALALVQDSPINWAPYPSAELPAAAAALVTNLIPNPSCELTTNNWTAVPGTTGVAALTSAAPSTTTAFGTKVLKTTWSTASTAPGGGVISATIPVTAGLVYSLSFGHVKSSIATRLNVIIDWYNGASYISSSLGTETVTVAGAINVGFQIANAVAPAGATLAQVKVITVAGTSTAVWSIGAYLETDGVIFTQTTAVVPYFDGDGSVPVADQFTAWTGAQAASTSTALPVVMLARNVNPNPSVEVNSTGWAASAVNVSGTAPGGFTTGARDQGGTGLDSYSFMARLAGDGTTSVASSTADLTIKTPLIDCTVIPAGRLVQLAMWAASAVLAGTVTSMAAITVQAQWYNASSVAVGSPITLTSDARGIGEYSSPPAAIPATATQIQFAVVSRTVWGSGNTDAANTDARLFADAASVIYFGGV